MKKILLLLLICFIFSGCKLKLAFTNDVYECFDSKTHEYVRDIIAGPFAVPFTIQYIGKNRKIRTMICDEIKKECDCDEKI